MKKQPKTFDAVKMMRDIRNKIDAETAGMNFEQFKQYIEGKLKKSGSNLPKGLRHQSAQ